MLVCSWKNLLAGFCMHSTLQRADPSLQMPALETSDSAREIDDFIYLISHDVRASVRALLELPQWIAEDLEEAGVKLDGSLASSIEMMNRHTGRLDRMLVDLLTYSRVGRMQEMCRIDINAALDTVLGDAKLPQRFSVTRDIACKQVTMGNRDILTLLDALVQNARKHHDKAGGRIHVATATDADQVVVTVSDDGPGIPPEFRERVFEAMQTLRPRDEIEGSGMGLATTRKIASVYGGTAHVTASVFGAGTGIKVRLGAQI
jgi:signal transduction histidine kinase